MSRTNRGAVLVSVVLLLLAALGLAHGIFLAARLELRVSQSSSLHLQLRAGAERAVEGTIRAMRTAWLDSVPVGTDTLRSSTSVVPLRTDVIVRRLSREAWLIEADASHERGSSMRAAALAWVADPVERLMDLGSIVTVGNSASVTLDGDLDAAAALSLPPPLDSADCAPWREDFARSAPAPPTALSAAADTLLPELGRWALDDLVAMSTPVSGASVTPGPVERLGRCLTSDPDNFGDPARPGGLCGGHLPLRSRVGDLTLEGGTGQGVLVVRGDLTLTRGARFAGLVLVSGSLVAREAATLEGYVWARGGLSVEAGSRIVGGVCRAARAIAANRDVIGVRRSPEPMGPLR